MNGTYKIRKLVREILYNKKNDLREPCYWAGFYHSLSNTAHHNLIAIKLILNNSELSAEEKNQKITNQYEIYLSQRKALKTPAF